MPTKNAENPVVYLCVCLIDDGTGAVILLISRQARVDEVHMRTKEEWSVCVDEGERFCRGQNPVNLGAGVSSCTHPPAASDTN